MLVRRFRALTLAAALFTIAAAVRRGPDQGAGRHHAEAALRLQHRRRLPARHLRPVHRRTGRRSTRNPTGCRSSRSARRRRAGRISPRSSPRRRTSPSSIATSRSRSSCTARAASPTTQARALAKEGKAVVWIDGGLHATEVVGAHQLIETVYQLVSRTDEETTRILRDVIVVAVHANPDGMQMVSKCYMQNAGSAAAPHLQPAALREVRGARQQPRLLHVEHEGIPEHEQAHVLGVAAADHVQPSPVRPGRHGDLLAAVPRSVQLQLRSDDRHRPRHGRRRDAPPLPAGREARLHDALGRGLFDVVERRPAHDGLLPEHHRPADRDHRQPDAVADPGDREPDPAARAICRRRSRRRSGTSASRSTTR